MIPYIVALVFLIAIILYQVYSSSEPFTTDASGTQMDASGTQMDASGTLVGTDASGNEIRLSLSDLFGLLGPFKTKGVASKPAPTIPEPSLPPVVPPTAASSKEIEDRIAKAVAKQIKDDLASQRTTDDLHDKYAPCDLTDSEAQGQEFEKQYPRSSNQGVDMSEYIRKDSIPCWNCSIP